MNLKRVQSSDGEIRVAISTDTSWRLLPAGVELIEVISGTTDLSSMETTTFDMQVFKDVIPFQPTAYRDFMLYEQHVIDASRGFVKKYLPKLYPIVKTYEAIMGKPFPKLKPQRRYYDHPIYYIGNHLNFFSEGDTIKIPHYTAQLDYELEIGVFIGKPLKNASIDEVKDSILGFVVLNDFSARDVQMSEMSSGFGPMKTKNFGSAISSSMASRDAIIDRIEDLQVSVLINEKKVATSSTRRPYYSLLEAIAYASWEEQLHAGELFGSGTIPGCSGIENGQMLSSGDVIALSVEGIGTLTNTIE